MSRPRPGALRGGALLVLVAVLLGPACADAEQALIAVAANFVDVAERLERQFEESSGHSVTITAGSTGKLYAQIRRGAPYDAFLAADQRRPELLVEDGLAVPDSRFTYAQGRLVVWSADGSAAEGLERLEREGVRRVALANPDLAPYGLAAREVLESRGHWQALEGRLVFGENVGQAFAMVASRNADVGLLALSSLRTRSEAGGWIVPADLHAPIRQDAVLLRRGENNRAARDFLAFLRSPASRRALADSGYDLP